MKKSLLFALAVCISGVSFAAATDTVRYTICSGETVTLEEWTGRYTSDAGYTFRWYENQSVTPITGETLRSYNVLPTSDCVYMLVVLRYGMPVDTLCFKITVKQNTTGTFNVSACDSLTWIDNITYTESIYTPTVILRNAEGCDSVVSLHLTIHNGVHGSINKTACDSYTWHGTTYTSSGTMTYSYVDNNGCHSDTTLHLTIEQSTHNSEWQTSCDSYYWQGTTYTTGGDKTRSYTNSQGCPSTDTLHLTIKQSTSGTDVKTACDAYNWIDGNTYIGNTSTPTVTLRNSAGCDSIVTLHLTIGYSQHTSQSQSACDSYTWQTSGQTYTESGAKVFRHTPDQYGCVNTDTLHLTIVSTNHNVLNVAECGEYEWHNNVYTRTCTAVYRYSDDGGVCDNSDTLHLTIYDAQRPDVKPLVEKKHTGSTTPWMLIYPRTEGEAECSYQWYKDGVPIDGATKQYYQLHKESAGTMVDYSVWVADANMLQCGTFSTKTVVFENSNSKQLDVYPNPSTGRFAITLDLDENTTAEGTIYTIDGMKVKSISIDGNNCMGIEEVLAPGTYILRVKTSDGTLYTQRIVVK